MGVAKEKIAIIGIGEVPTGIYPQRSPWEIIYEICTQAVHDSGLDKNDIEAVITVAPQAQARLAAEISFGKIPEELGLKGCKDVCICNAGGASTSNCLRLAEQLITSGQAKSVLIPHVTVHSCIEQDELINFFAQAGMDLQWEYPFGTTYNAIIGMLTRRYMHESGAGPEEMASIVVSMRKWATLDPNSIFFNKKVPSIEEILSSPMVADPLHKRECNILADGGAAMVVTSAELAPKVTQTPVYKLGEGAVFFTACPVLRENEMMIRGFKESAAKALYEAGLTFMMRLVVLLCAEEFDLKGLWGFEYANTCSKPRLDAFGGGAHVIDLRARKSVGWTSTNEWLCRALQGDDPDA